MQKTIQEFTLYLEEAGAVILPSSSEYEVIRFECEKGLGIVYRNKKNQISATLGPSSEAWDCFQNKRSWSSRPKKKRTKVTKEIEKLKMRDGDLCFFCKKKLYNSSINPISVEHLLSKKHGGSDHISNLVLAHEKCNQEAGTLSIMEKLKIREKVNDNHEKIYFEGFKINSSTDEEELKKLGSKLIKKGLSLCSRSQKDSFRRVFLSTNLNKDIDLIISLKSLTEIAYIVDNLHILVKKNLIKEISKKSK